MRLIGVLSTALIAACAANMCIASPFPSYHVAKQYVIGGTGGWDYVSLDQSGARLYVSHGDRLEVLDTSTGMLVGEVRDTPGIHGAAIAQDLNKGFTSNAGDNSVSIFDTRSLETLKKVTVNRPDFIVYDSFTQRVFPLNARVSVIDASGEKVGEVDLGGTPEAAVSDEKGLLFVNLADKEAVAVVDTKRLTVTRTYPIRCSSPHSLSYDPKNKRLFVGCTNGFRAVDAVTGNVVAGTVMCGGVDSSAFDRERGLIFESCSEGVLSVIRQLSADHYELIDTVKTQLLAKTMAFDVKNRRIYLPTSDLEAIASTDPKEIAEYRRGPTPGTFRVLVLEP